MKYLILIIGAVSCSQVSTKESNNATTTNADIVQAARNMAKSAYKKGWVDGSNSVSKMQNDNTYNYESLKLKSFKDSVEFAQFIDNK